MLYLETLSKKRYYTKPNGDTIIDLTASSIDGMGERPLESRIIMVTEETAMRPDLLSQKIYGDDGKLDLLLKYNGISNPFSLKEGDILVVPDQVQMLNLFRTPPADETVDYTVNQREFVFLSPEEKSENKRMKILEIKKQNMEKLAPNRLSPGDSNVKYKDGKIIFGEDTTTITHQNCPETLTRARVKEKLLNSKIFK